MAGPAFRFGTVGPLRLEQEGRAIALRRGRQRAQLGDLIGHATARHVLASDSYELDVRRRDQLVRLARTELKLGA
jgi:hypothetical protein